MKRIYTKPDIVFEDFSLSVNIAGGCEVQANFSANQGCGLDVSEQYGLPAGSIVIFADALQCVRAGSDGDVHNGICYHVPSQDYNLFSS